MTSWDISQSGVQGVLSKAATAAEGLAKVGGELEKTLPSAASSAGTISAAYCGAPPSGPVEAALSQFFLARRKDLAYVALRTGNSLNGAAAATNAYTEGNLKMAATAQSQAVAEPRINESGHQVDASGKEIDPSGHGKKQGTP
ncbi:DUF6507 family protein [Streptomyces sp. H27-D2]|uniref:DUF6507 family protein n=1 Tax=Streptomyces sp. H27-D2 TaxID=3046304 RepID=UPI002DC03D4E|nr:DUF6507 family protein [Streptomyces sp. H27-D2]MEC4016747.1 DUF6507 family protein [Streptomyces sp. H27-D2]